MIEKIVSGGQTGVDRAALDAALESGLPCGGWCPAGRLAEDGPLDEKYPLEETPSSDYAERTEWNVRDSDGTLVLFMGRPTGGTALTVSLTKQMNKPRFLIDLADAVDSDSFLAWIQEKNISVLNVAGPRESRSPGLIYSTARLFIETLLADARAEPETK